MGKRGPASKPTALKLLHGTDKVHPERINRNEPQPAKVDIVPPAWMTEAELSIWDRLAPDMIQKGVLTAWDVDAFADLCAMIVINQRAMQDVLENGASCTTVDRELANGTIIFVIRRNPAWQIARESSAAIVTLGGRFGLNPSDRQALSIGGGTGGDTDDDLLT